MPDLLSQDNVDQFRAAIRDVTDTFHKSPVTLLKTSGAEIELVAGMKPDDSGGGGGSHGEMSVREEGSETVERWLVTFNRDYLEEKNLVDPDSDTLLIADEDRIVFKGKRYAIVELTDKALFRGVPMLVLLTVVR